MKNTVVASIMRLIAKIPVVRNLSIFSNANFVASAINKILSLAKELERAIEIERSKINKEQMVIDQAIERKVEAVQLANVQIESAEGRIKNAKASIDHAERVKSKITNLAS